MSLVDEINSNLNSRRSRSFGIGSCNIGGSNGVLLQSMCATRTTDIPKTLAQINLLKNAGADLIRIAIDSRNDVEALREIRKETEANLVVDLQESYRLAEKVAPFVQKIRYNPGHLHHHQKSVPVSDKVKFLTDVAGSNDCAIRIGVNFGSLDPELKQLGEKPWSVALRSVENHVELMSKFSFDRFVVSIKSSDPFLVVEVNTKFHELHPEVPLHLGVTEAGLMPEGAIKTRIAFEKLLSKGIGDTVRVSLTLPDEEKDLEIQVAREIIEDVREGKFRSVPDFKPDGINIISCPSCSRVENGAFVKLAEEVKKVTTELSNKEPITVAVMGCRVNGPGETDEADFGLWCAPKHVNLKKGTELLGAFSYEEIIPKLVEEIKNR